MGHLKKGYVHLYTGKGKGKTTAALGLALRAAGAGYKVFIAQFAKGTPTGELNSLKRLSKLIKVRQFGRRSFIKRNPSGIDRACAARGMEVVKNLMSEGLYDIIILDELCGACRYNLIPLKDALDMIKKGLDGWKSLLPAGTPRRSFLKPPILLLK